MDFSGVETGWDEEVITPDDLVADSGEEFSFIEPAGVSGDILVPEESIGEGFEEPDSQEALGFDDGALREESISFAAEEERNWLDYDALRMVQATPEGLAAIEEIVQECRAQGFRDEYDIALWLHDWLINHAEYDTSYSIHEPEGVLVYGFGVCQSYTTAYGLLLDEFGIENDVVVSDAMNHTWNLVKLNGKWCHVDVTWDDPVNGTENKYYFGMNDAFIRRDHTFPAVSYDCSSLDNYYYLKRERQRCFSSEQELHSLLDAFRSTKTQVGTLVYVGNGSSFNFSTAVKNWYDKNPIGYRITGMSAYKGTIMLSYDYQSYCMVTLKVIGHGSINQTSGIYPTGTSFTVKATPGRGYKLEGWYMGDSVVNTDTFSFTANGHVTVVALFEKGEDTQTPTPTSTNTPSPTPTNTPSPTPTNTPSPTPTNTPSPTPTLTGTPVPNTPTPTPTNTPRPATPTPVPTTPTPTPMPGEDLTDRFPDEIFLEHVRERIGITEEEPILWEDLEDITYLDLTDMDISDLSGIECFPALQYLWCDGNDLDRLSLVGLADLEEVDCSRSDLMYLTLEDLPSLVSLNCSDNLLSFLDVSGCPALESLYCQENLLEELDLSENTNLQYVNVSYNLIPEETDVYLSHEPEVFIYLPQALEIDNDITSTFDDDAFRAIVADAMDGEITRRKCLAVTSINVPGEGIQDLTGLSYFENLEKLNVSDNELMSLDVSDLENLKELDFSQNLITSVELGELDSLTRVQGDDNELEEIDVSGLENLEWLSLQENMLTYLDITNNEELEYLDVSGNYFTTKDNIERYHDPAVFIYEEQHADQEDEEDEDPYIELEEEYFTLYPALPSAYSTAQLEASLYGTTGTIKYKSSNKKIAKVSSSGLITAKKAGEVTITAYVQGQEEIMAECYVTVENPKIYNTSKVKVKKKKKITLGAYAYPDVPLTYKSLDKSIATVSKKGVVKGKKKGSTKIQVTVGKVSKKIKVTVY